MSDNLVGSTVAHRLTAFNLTDGSRVAGFSVAVDPPGADPKALLQRGALALDAGRVIIPYGGNSGDCGAYHGWLVSASEGATGPPDSFEVEAAAGQHGGAIWGAGDGPSVDRGGQLFTATGNGFDPTATPDLQESVVELGPRLHLIAHWTAGNWQCPHRRGRPGRRSSPGAWCGQPAGGAQTLCTGSIRPQERPAFT